MLGYLLGTAILETKAYEMYLINVLALNGIQCYEINKNENTVSFRVYLYSLNKVKRIFEDYDTELNIVKICGVPSLFYRYRKRYFLLFGAFISAFIILISQRYIWSFDIAGNSTVTDEEVLSVLDDLGCRVGAKIDDIDFDMLHNNFLLRVKDVAWISVNMDGTKANVEIREVKRGTDKAPGIHNVVASEDGQVELISVYEGKAQVQIGDIVHKGDLLISGAETYREEDMYYSGADGSVMAVVNRRFSVEVPTVESVKEKTGNFIERKKIKFFSFYVNLFVNSSISYAKYDTMKECRQMVLFDVVELPVWIETEVIYEYVDGSIELSSEEACAKALKQYREVLSEYAENSQLLSSVYSHSFENGVYVIDCSLYCLTDIAERREITLMDSQK